MASLLARLRRALPYVVKGHAGTASVDWPGDRFQQGIARPRRDYRHYSTVFACVSIISTDVAKIPLKHWKRQADGGRVELRQSPLARLLAKPNHYQTLTDLMQQFMAGLLYRGNAYILIQRDSKFEPVALYCISPDRCAPWVSPSGEIFYNVSRDPLMAPADTTSLFPARDVIHHRINTLHHPLVGMSPIEAARSTADAQSAIIDQTRGFFEKRSLPSGVLMTPKKLTKDVVDRLREQWEDFYGGANAGRTAVLEDGTEWKQLTMTAADSQTIELLQWQTGDIARAFGVPLHRLGELDRVTYRNAETLQRVYLSNTLGWYLTSIEQRATTAFGLHERDEVLDYDVDALLRLETDARFDAYGKGVQGGFLTPNEARSRENLNPIDGGDTLFLQAQMTPVQRLSAEPAPAPEPDDPPALPAPDASSEPEKGDIRAAVRKAVRDRRRLAA